MRLPFMALMLWALTAENLVATKYAISPDTDLALAFAYNSQMQATAAQQSGRLAKEIVPVEIPQRKKDPIVFKDDEFIKPNSSKEILAKLRPAFKKDGSVTAGNASTINDGASALVLMSLEKCESLNLTPVAKLGCSWSGAKNHGNWTCWSISRSIEKSWIDA